MLHGHSRCIFTIRIRGYAFLHIFVSDPRGFPAFQARKNLRSVKNDYEYGFLYSKFSEGAEFWEFHELFRKLILTGIIVFLTNLTHRAVVATFVCVLSVALLNYFRPHPSSLVFMVEQGSFILATFKYIAVLLLDTSTAEKAGHLDQNIMGNLLIALDIFFSGSFAFLLAIVFVTKSSILFQKGRRDNRDGNNGDKRGDQRSNLPRKSIVFHRTSLEALKNDILASKTVDKYEQDTIVHRQHIREVQLDSQVRLQMRLQKRLKMRKLEVQLSKEKTLKSGN